MGDRCPEGKPRTAALAYRSDIDGLRAISILAVVLYHADLPIAPGGFVGVDVFFVISGYLITGLLVRELVESGRIDLLAFWARRIRRLLPSALVVIAVSALFALAILPPYDIRTAGSDLIAAAAYFVNWQLALRSVDYLAEGERHSLFLHFWSLSVEEQFYFLWPIVLILLGLLMRSTQTTGRAALSGITAAVVIAGLGSFVLNLYLTATSQPFAFFGTASRAWQLLAGALIATIPALAAGTSTRRALQWAGIVLIMLAILLYSAETAYPGIAALVPVSGAAMIVLAGHCQGSAATPRTWLSSSGMVFVGRISYAWYLWHWPVLLLGDTYLESATWLQRIGLLGVSFVLATITHMLIERPVRFAPMLALSTARSIAMGILITAAAVTTGLALETVKGAQTIRLADGIVIDPQSVRDDKPRLYDDDCHLNQWEDDLPPCVYGDHDGGRTVMLFGDSHAAQWFPAIDTAARKRGWRLLSRTRAACPPIAIRLWTRRLKREYSECEEWRNAVLTEIASLNPDLVILAGSSRYVPIVGREARELTGEERLRALRAGETQVVRAIHSSSDARVVLIRDTLKLPEDPLDCLFRLRMAPERCAWPRQSVFQENMFPFSTYPASELVSTLDLTDLICGPRSCSAVKDGILVMRDSHHLTATYAATLAATFEQLLMETQQSKSDPR